MPESDLTIVILRNIQAELGLIHERMDSHADHFAAIQQRFDTVGHQFSHLDKRITNVEEILVRTATSLGVDAQGSRQRVIRSEGEIAELKVRVTALETLLKTKPTP